MSFTYDNFKSYDKILNHEGWSQIFTYTKNTPKYKTFLRWSFANNYNFFQLMFEIIQWNPNF